jgi:TPR repeat protein
MRLALAALALMIVPLPAFSAADGSAAQCLSFSNKNWDISDQEKFQREQQTWRISCQRALYAEPDNPKVIASLGGAWSSLGFKDISLPLTRKAAAMGDTKALFDIYTLHYSFSRHLDREPYVTREEGANALRKAAELGDPAAIQVLMRHLERGDLIKRNLNEAVVWAERAVKNPPKDRDAGDPEVSLGRLLIKLNDPRQRQRGMDILVGSKRSDAAAYFADAIRPTDPVRARKIYEDLLFRQEGHAAPELADMLFKGEGGPADPKRAVDLLDGGSWLGYSPALRAHYGRLLVEGKYVKPDPQKGIEYMSYMTQWSIEWRHEVMDLLARNPSLRLSYPNGMFYDAVEAVELGEPGAAMALIDLQLSNNAQFRDLDSGCHLAQWAAENGFEDAKPRLKDCTAIPGTLH